jgi:hypothetical protein
MIRLFCRLDTEPLDVDRPIPAVITGMSKPVRTTFSDVDYAQVRGDEYFSRNPRSITSDYQTIDPNDSLQFAIRSGTRDLSCRTLSSEPDLSG